MPHTLSAQIAFGLYFALCLVIVAIGGRRERIAGAAMIVIGVLQNLSHDRQHIEFQYWTAGLDFVLLVVLGSIAATSSKTWPLWASAFQLVATVTHGVKAIDPSVHGWAYLSASILFGWLALAAVFVGSLFAFVEIRKLRALTR